MNSRSKNWCFTSYNVESEPFLQQRNKIQYLIWGRETCPDTNRPHLQGFVAFKVRTKFSTLKNFENFHFEKTKGTIHEAVEYCKKDGDFTEYGVLPSATGNNSAFKQVLAFAKKGEISAIEDEHPGIYIRYKRTLESLAVYNTSELENSCGVWIHGPPRCGKDYAVRQLGNVYNKGMNKWWDNYKGEPIVLLSDVQPDQAKWLGHFLKIWADRYAFNAEIKCGTIYIRPKQFYVTSNFSIDEIFEGKIKEAIAARFDELDFSTDTNIIKNRLESIAPRRVLACLLDRQNIVAPAAVEVTSDPQPFQLHDGFSSEMATAAATGVWSEDEDFVSPSFFTSQRKPKNK
ncbi:replication-associated protein [Cybaeus spider associated circular virus 1]|uniref:ATP-dependent helicase Rep n=1 Tax=Cybaeus spider associated circular virus 1 TaxID=2293277 RepID=A0A346BPA8_9VIRU|nr:replication-associated protein [Cybaeus spider associated circular virus 1]AXL65905.1 replication-associated protein [Cybaeus spider associated circular virus 1]